MLKFKCDFCGDEYTMVKEYGSYYISRSFKYKTGINSTQSIYNGKEPCHKCEKRIEKAKEFELERIKKE